jgi:hypothetical protein
MSSNIIIVTGLFYLIPGNAEICYRHTSACGNMGLTGVYLDVINKRNFVYFSGFISLVVLVTPFKLLTLFSYCLFVFSILLYFNCIKCWHLYIR